MPFESEKQRKFLWAKHPKIAREFADKEKLEKDYTETYKPRQSRRTFGPIEHAHDALGSHVPKGAADYDKLPKHIHMNGHKMHNHPAVELPTLQKHITNRAHIHEFKGGHSKEGVSRMEYGSKKHHKSLFRKIFPKRGR